MNTEIIPAIMPKNFADMRDKVSRVSSFVKYVQLDIMDGVFVEEKTWPYVNDDGSYDKLADETLSLPEWDKINYEIDLMVSNPEKDSFDWISRGASRIIFHLKSSDNILDVVQKIRREYGRVEESPSAIEIGVAVGVEEDISVLEKFLPYIDFVQFMGIAKIGYQKQPFEDIVLDNIRKIKKAHPEIIISVDGGVSFDTAQELIEAGATRLVSGSYIFTSDNIKEAIDELSGV